VTEMRVMGDVVRRVTMEDLQISAISRDRVAFESGVSLGRAGTAPREVA
jgi:hypothetical protein